MTEELGKTLPLWSALPFIGLLLSVACLPVLARDFWDRHYGKVSAAWALLFALPFLLAYRGPAVHELLAVLIKDYVPFIILLWSLYTIAGGILLEAAPPSTPLANVFMLALGSLMASWIGTTGASMLMIRPVLRMNRRRVRKTHIVVFFIFLISNIGGVLTPLGDPPLLLGLLHGVPFFWTLTLFPQFALLLVLLLSVFFLVDSAMFRRESIGRLRGLQPRITEVTPRGIQLRGLYNLIFLAGVVAGVLFSGSVRLGHIEIWGLSVAWESVLRDLLLLLMGQWSLRLTPRRIREAQGFNWRAMKELAFLFGGMFITLLPVLAMLRAGAAGGLALVTRSIHEPWHYFWVTGLFSSFLDNAPTYLAFVNTVLGAFYPGRPEPQALQALLAERAIYLKAISCGAVFMGAMTYLGNAPNFMVRSIAEEYGVKMPSFLGYMVYSTATLLPCFVLVCFLFFGP